MLLNGLDLFSGIGGITLALSPWVRPVAYCEIERYARAVLLSRMSDGTIPAAPIWDNVQTLRGDMLPKVDIVYGGFPCQDISCAGRGKGLEGERSGLFFEIMRLVDEIQPSLLFLENVPAITTRGLGAVTAEITRRGYDCRWTTLSAAEVGANHKRDRWWLLANAERNGGRSNATRYQLPEESAELQHSYRQALSDNSTALCRDVADTERMRELQQKGSEQNERRWSCNESWWRTEPDVGRVVNGLPFRVDRIKGLGNSVVPQCAREAFKELSGLQEIREGCF